MEWFAGTLVWRYQFEPDGTGTLVTESYEVTRPISRIGWFIIERLAGLHDRRADLRRGMERPCSVCAKPLSVRMGLARTRFHASNSDSPQ